MNYKQVIAIQNANKQRILKVCPNIKDESGIYVFYRTDENGIKHAYAGQSCNLLSRLGQHLSGYQHIDLSLKKHGLFSNENPYGYKIHTFTCPIAELDKREQETILELANKSFQLKNHTSGSQGIGKSVFENAKQPKTYMEGIAQGRNKQLDEIRTFFEKYLDFSPKNQNKVTLRKFEEFKELIKNGKY